MQYSMTGYGRCERKAQRLLMICEIKTLNSKFLDFSPRLPKELNPKETEIRSLVSEKLKRGKIMLNIELDIDPNDDERLQVDEALFKNYYGKYQQLAKTANGETQGLVRLAIESPEVVKMQELSQEDIPWLELKNCIDEALDECDEFRKKEGEVLEGKLLEYIQNIDVRLSKINEKNIERDERIREKLHRSMEDIRDKVKVDENRFEQELIFYLERLDISEEKVRLKQHLNFFTETLSKQSYAGKKLGFISQEIGREINTIGSKANNADIQRMVVEMKDDLEKIKEQLLNLV